MKTKFSILMTNAKPAYIGTQKHQTILILHQKTSDVHGNHLSVPTHSIRNHLHLSISVKRKDKKCLIAIAATEKVIQSVANTKLPVRPVADQETQKITITVAIATQGKSTRPVIIGNAQIVEAMINYSYLSIFQST
jgi:hypothetical protein